MNGLEAAEHLSKLQTRITALTKVIDYLDDDRDFYGEIDVLTEIKSCAESEREQLDAKLRAVQL